MEVVYQRTYSHASRESVLPWIDVKVDDGNLVIGEANYKCEQLAISGKRMNLAAEFQKYGQQDLPLIIYVSTEEELKVCKMLDIPYTSLAFIGQYDTQKDILTILDYEDLDTAQQTYQEAMDVAAAEERRIDESSDELIQLLVDNRAESAQYDEKVRERVRQKLQDALVSKEEQQRGG